jgi:hypothetical protein
MKNASQSALKCTLLAQEDFVSLAGVGPQTHGAENKYQGCCWDLFELLGEYLSSYKGTERN